MMPATNTFVATGQQPQEFERGPHERAHSENNILFLKAAELWAETSGKQACDKRKRNLTVRDRDAIVDLQLASAAPGLEWHGVGIVTDKAGRTPIINNICNSGRKTKYYECNPGSAYACPSTLAT